MAQVTPVENIPRNIRIKCTYAPDMHERFKWFGGNSNYEAYNSPTARNYRIIEGFEQFVPGMVIYPFTQQMVINSADVDMLQYVLVHDPVNINRESGYYASMHIYVPEYENGKYEHNWAITQRFYRLYFFNKELRDMWKVDGFINPHTCGMFPLCK